MELRNLRCFVVVAEELNFGRAAARLHITQPGLSQRIKALERSLGAQLFERNRQRVSLTGIGTALLPEVRALLEQADRIETMSAYLRRHDDQHLRLSYTRSAGVGVATEITSAFRRRHPEIEVHTSLGFTAVNLAAVLAGDADVAFLRMPADIPDGVSTMTVGHDPIVAALPSGHPLLRAAELKVSDIVEEPLIFFPRETAPGMWAGVLRAVYGPDSEPPIVRNEPEEPLMLAAVAEGAGISLLAQAAATMIDVPGVEIRPLRPEVSVPLSLAWRRSNPNPALAQFLSCARAVAAAHEQSHP